MTYNEVLLDSALFKKLLSLRAKEFLKSNNTVLSATFFAEVAAYSKVLDPGYSATLTSNINTILSMYRVSGKIIMYKEPFDIKQCAEQLSKEGHRVCVMSEDCLLAERLLHGGAVNVDVYDLNSDTLIQHRSRGNVMCEVDKAHANKHIEGIQTGTVLRTGNAFGYKLGKKLSEDGAEGYIYRVEGHPELVAKIYKYEPSSIKRRHLYRLVAIGKETRAKWCAFPENLLYHNGTLVGFSMPKIDCVTMSEDSLYLGDDEDIAEDRLDKKLSYQLDFCTTLLTQIKVLNCFGIIVPDMNDSNGSTYTDGKPVVIYDTDSFAYGAYFGNIIDDKAFSRSYQIYNKEQLAQMCEENAMKKVFRILSLGMYPFPEENRPYCFRSTDKEITYRRQYFPANVLAGMDEVFTAVKLPSLNLLLNDLSNAKRELLNDQKKDITIRQMRDRALESIGIKAQKTYKMNAAPVPNVVSVKNTPQPAVVQATKPKKHILPWIASLSVLTGSVLWFLVSNGIITI